MASPLKTPLGFNPIHAVPAAPAPAPAAAAAPAPVAASGAPPSSGLLDQAKAAFAKVNQFRDDLNLPNPGTYE
ncbi:hypothetical protein BGZ65_005902, partial [Modicella reniformis]